MNATLQPAAEALYPVLYAFALPIFRFFIDFRVPVIRNCLINRDQEHSMFERQPVRETYPE
jgi:hypothetical protein